MPSCRESHPRWLAKLSSGLSSLARLGLPRGGFPPIQMAQPERSPPWTSTRYTATCHEHMYSHFHDTIFFKPVIRSHAHLPSPFPCSPLCSPQQCADGYLQAGAITGFVSAFVEGPIDFFKSQIQVQIIRAKGDPNFKRVLSRLCTLVIPKRLKDPEPMRLSPVKHSWWADCALCGCSGVHQCFWLCEERVQNQWADGPLPGLDRDNHQEHTCQLHLPWILRSSQAAVCQVLRVHVRPLLARNLPHYKRDCLCGFSLVSR